MKLAILTFSLAASVMVAAEPIIHVIPARQSSGFISCPVGDPCAADTVVANNRVRYTGLAFPPTPNKLTCVIVRDFIPESIDPALPFNFRAVWSPAGGGTGRVVNGACVPVPGQTGAQCAKLHVNTGTVEDGEAELIPTYPGAGATGPLGPGGPLASGRKTKLTAVVPSLPVEFFSSTGKLLKRNPVNFLVCRAFGVLGDNYNGTMIVRDFVNVWNEPVASLADEGALAEGALQ